MSVSRERHSDSLATFSNGIAIQTAGPGFHDFTEKVSAWLAGLGVGEGVVTLFVRHTSASLTIQENADPDVQLDLLDALSGLAPESPRYRHGSEGPDDMPAHIKGMLTSTSLQIPVRDGAMELGTWQGIYLIEHRARPHHRKIAMNFTGTVV
ncbi:MAG: secondary thiamine-phosphate synthase enzyme YjbQ [Hyphomicrobiaceae bacterium]